MRGGATGARAPDVFPKAPNLKDWSRRTEMASIMEQQQEVSQGRRRARKSKCSLQTEFRCLNLLLLLCFINSIGTSAEHVTGTKGGSVTLSCELGDHEITVIGLIRRSKNILVCNNEECKSVDDSKVFKKGKCDVVLKNLIVSDAGKYVLKVYYKNIQTEADKQDMEYHLHIHDNISVKIGEKVKLDVLLINADKVEHQNIHSTEWTEVWTRGHGVSSDRLTVRDGNLTISNFTVSDTGTYRVLDSEGEIWITVTVTVTESSTQSKGEDNDTEQHTVEPWIIVVSVIGPLVLALIISAVIWKYQHQNRNRQHVPVRQEEIVQQSRTSRDDTVNL